VTTVATDDISLNVETAGAGVPLVLLHGSFMNTLSWEPQLDGLAGDFQVIAPDLRGHGRTRCPLTGRSFDRAKDVVAVLDHLRIPQAIVGGHSMGGPIAVQVALDYPERCLGLVLLATGPGPPDRPLKATPESRAAAEAEAQRLLDLGTVEYFRTTGAYTAPGVREFLEDVERRRRFETILDRNNPAFLADWIRLGGVDIPPELETHLTSHRRRRLSEIKMPVLFMVGHLDTVFLPVVDLLRSELPRTEIEVLPGATHMLAIDSAEAVNRRIIEFGRQSAS
jgi:pimeloyl-ACP methyl ester carboxylesterase